MKKLFCVILAVAASVVSMAQALQTDPPAELKKLDYMVGEWSTAGKFTMMGMEMDMTMEVKVRWDGQFLRQETVNTVMGEKMTETVMLGWDSKKSEYLSHAFTNFSSNPRIERGKLNGEKLVMTSEPWDVMGMAMESRVSLWKSGSDLMMSMEFKEGDTWTKAGEWTFKKKA